MPLPEVIDESAESRHRLQIGAPPPGALQPRRSRPAPTRFAGRRTRWRPAQGARPPPCRPSSLARLSLSTQRAGAGLPGVTRLPDRLRQDPALAPYPPPWAGGAGMVRTARGRLPGAPCHPGPAPVTPAAGLAGCCPAGRLGQALSRRGAGRRPRLRAGRHAATRWRAPPWAAPAGLRGRPDGPAGDLASARAVPARPGAHQRSRREGQTYQFRACAAVIQRRWHIRDMGRSERVR